MSRRANSKVIGGFVVGVVALIVVVFVVFGSGQMFATKDTYVIYFSSSVNGLNTGSPVKLRGVPVGSVKTITALIDEKGDFYVEVTIEVLPYSVENVGGLMVDASAAEIMEALVNNGMRARLETESLVTGRLYVRLDYFPETEITYVGFESPHPEIPSIPTSTEEFTNRLDKTLDRIETFPFEEIADQLIETLEAVDTLASGPNMQRTLTKLEETLDEMGHLMHNLDTDVVPAAAKLAKSAEAAQEAIETANNLMLRIDDMSAENRNRLKRALEDFAAAARSIRVLTDYLERHPDAVIWGKD